MTEEKASTISYNFNHVCNYMLCADEDEADNKYRDEMLAVFDMTDFEEDIMVKKIEQLTELVKENDRFNTLCTKSANRYVLEDLSMGLMLLFNCDSFHLIHKCFQDFNREHDISDENYNLVMKYLEN